MENLIHRLQSSYHHQIWNEHFYRNIYVNRLNELLATKFWATETFCRYCLHRRALDYTDVYMFPRYRRYIL